MKLEKIVTRQENFADWYTSVITAANLIMYSSIKGVMIFQPNGWAIWNHIMKEMDRRFEPLGIVNVQLPLFIKYSEFAKEKEHVEGFAPETFLVTKRGNEELDEPYVIRPTSEILFCNYFKKIVNSYNDLPILYNQWCSVYRAEKTTRPFLRNSEFFWHELHTIHATDEEAKKQAVNMIEVYEKFVREYLCISVLVGEKTEGERFAGADSTYTIEAMMQDGQALQCGTSHYLGQNFSNAYEIKFQNKKNEYENVYQTSAGISTRMMGAIIMSHADDKGLVLPFGIAPTQVAILPIFADKEPMVNELTNEAKAILANYRVKVDNSNNGFGHKIAEQEVNGTPFSIIIGPKDAIKNEITLVRRENGKKINIDIKLLERTIEVEINDYQKSLYDVSKKRLDENIVEVSNIEEYTKAIENKKIALAPWGGNQEDEKQLKERTGTTPRCIKTNTRGTSCFFTGKPAKYLVYFGRAY